MLAQNFKTAEELGLRSREYAALVQVLGMLERGELRHVPFQRSLPAEFAYSESPGLFNMREWVSQSDCGTALCIRGTAEAIMRDRFDYPDNHEALNELFLPPKVFRDNITTAQAAAALRNYLTTGEARWEEALAG